MTRIQIHPSVAIEGEAMVFDNRRSGNGDRRGTAQPNGPDPFLTVAAAMDAQMLADVRLPAPDPKRPRPSARRGAVGPRMDRVDVSVSAEESAVLLVEDANGLLSWRFPDVPAGGAVRRGGTPSAQSGTLRFTLAGAPVETGTRRRSWIGEKVTEKLFEPVRVAVLRFLVSHSLDAAVRRIEGDMATGLVSMKSVDAATAWIPGAPDPIVPANRPLRVLLMVHGTFSSTAGSFAGLAGTPEWQAVSDRYHLILGQDHRTLAETPEDNARQIADSLYRLALPPGTIVDAIAFSRGGLVLRSLAEQIAPKRLPDLSFGKAVFIGCTNGGTLLAEPQNWETLVTIYTNLIANAAKLGLGITGAGVAAPWVSYAIKTIGRFVQMLSEMAISERRLPGLAAMEPDGDVVAVLNGSTALAPGKPDYFVVASDFQLGGGTGALLRSAVLFAADRFADTLMKEGNDLVVHTQSMANFGASRTATERRVISVEEGVFHTAYFTSPTTRRAIADWLAPQAELGKSILKAQVDDLIGTTRRGEPPRPSAPRVSGLASQGSAPKVERHIAAEIEPFPRIERKANLYVTVSPDAIEVGDHAAAATTIAPVSLDRSLPLSIIVLATRNCVIEGEAQADIALTGEEDEIRKFAVRGIAAGESEVLVEARQGMVDGAGGRVLASFQLKPIFISRDERAERVVQTLLPPPRSTGQAILRIYEFIDTNKDVVLRFDLSNEDPAFALLEDVRLPSSFPLAEFSANILASLDDAYNLTGETYESRLGTFIDEARVRTAELIPERIRKTLWSHRDSISEVQVISQEAFVPWELMCLFDPASRKPEEQPLFLAEWGMTRWLHNVPMSRKPIDLKSGKAFYFVPDYEGEAGLYLASAQQEREMLETKLSAIALTPTARDLRDYLTGPDSKKTSLLHFACHGVASQGAIMAADLILRRMTNADGTRIEEKLSWQTIKANADFGTDRRPLIFINACQTGKPGQSIAGIAGFADAFLRPMNGTGAAAFIGALWSIDDRLATLFSETIYDALLAGAPLNEAVKRARKAAQTKGDFTWLSYCVYGG